MVISQRRKPARKKSKKTAKQKHAPIAARDNRRPLAIRKQQRLGRIRRTMRYEIANLFTHAFGLGLAACGITLLLVKNAAQPSGTRLVGFIVYGTCIVLLYLASSLYHSLWDAKSKKVLRRLDHSAIYLAIAGTMTPVALLTVAGSFGTAIVITMWIFALTGIAVKLLFPHKFQKASVTAYIVMGWLAVGAIKPVYQALPSPALWLLLAGGLSYTAGTIFYSMRRLPYNHMVWHFFVLGGSITHFLSIYLYV